MNFTSLNFKANLLLLTAFLVPSPAATAPPEFDFATDTFAFANETYWEYGANGIPASPLRTSGAPYSRKCFVMVRATLQFHRFARFDPEAPLTDSSLLVERIQEILRIPAWRPPMPPEKRVVIPGYASLREFSDDYSRILQDNMGSWWPSYFRPTNAMVTFIFPRCSQQRHARHIQGELARGKIQALMMTRRIWLLNHVVIAYRAVPMENGDVDFFCYDPNHPEKPVVLRYSDANRSFYLPRTDYFPGGWINLFPVYQNRLR